MDAYPTDSTVRTDTALSSPRAAPEHQPRGGEELKGGKDGELPPVGNNHQGVPQEESTRRDVSARESEVVTPGGRARAPPTLHVPHLTWLAHSETPRLGHYHSFKAASGSRELLQPLLQPSYVCVGEVMRRRGWSDFVPTFSSSLPLFLPPSLLNARAPSLPLSLSISLQTRSNLEISIPDALEERKLQRQPKRQPRKLRRQCVRRTVRPGDGRQGSHAPGEVITIKEVTDVVSGKTASS